MSLGVWFWVIAVVAILVGAGGFYYSKTYPAWSWVAPWPIFVLVLILGWKVFGPAVH